LHGFIKNKLKDLLEKPFKIYGTYEYLTFRIGVIEFNGDGKSVEQLLRDATIALNYADSNETVNFSFFDEEMELRNKREKIIQGELMEVISGENASKIYLVYQPILNLKENRIAGFEALARMNSDHFGYVSPMEFISIAERKQLIVPLSNIIIRRACTFAYDLIKMGFDDIFVAVNISVIHILQEDFTETILGIIKETGIQGHNLELEITETIIMENFAVINERLRELRANGVKISIDDFGTGYSAFARLSELNVDTLKIDQSFIRDITDVNKDSLIARDIISIARRLGLKTVAEGVEHPVQRDYLLEYNCDMMQGYLFSKPVHMEEALALLKNHNNA